MIYCSMKQFDQFRYDPNESLENIDETNYGSFEKIFENDSEKHCTKKEIATSRACQCQEHVFKYCL